MKLLMTAMVLAAATPTPQPKGPTSAWSIRVGDGAAVYIVKPTKEGRAVPTPWIPDTQCRQEPIVEVPTGPSTRGLVMAVECVSGETTLTVAVACETGEADAQATFATLKIGGKSIVMALLCRTDMGVSPGVDL